MAAECDKDPLYGFLLSGHDVVAAVAAEDTAARLARKRLREVVDLTEDSQDESEMGAAAASDIVDLCGA